jgi:lysozyme
MVTSEAGKNLIKKFESLQLVGYLDAVKIPTIGWGTTRMDGRKPKVGEKITLEKAIQLFDADLAEFEDGVRDNVRVPLTQPQFDALVSFAYNVGIGNFKSSTLLRLINAGAPARDIQPQFLRWNKAGGKVLKGLTRRRLAEAVLFGPARADELVAVYRLDV